jgi:hypothetical protein
VGLYYLNTYLAISKTKRKLKTMFYSELKNYLTGVCDEETLDVFDASIEIMEKYNVPGYMDVLSEVVGDNQEQPDSSIVDLIQINIKACVVYLLTMQGINLMEDTSLNNINKIAEGLYLLPLYEDKATVESIVTSEQSDSEIFAELMNLVTEFQVEQLLSMVESIDENFVINVKVLVVDQIKQTVVNIVALQAQIKNYTDYKKNINNEASYGDKYFIEPAAIGLPFEDYLNLYQKDHLDLSATPVEIIAKDLIGIAYLSIDGTTNPLIIIRKHLINLFTDISSSTKVDVEVSKILVRFTK